MSCIWIDVEDLFRYALGSRRPSGIQRLAFEAEQAIVALHGSTGRVRFVRHNPLGINFTEVAWQDVAALYTGMIAASDTREKPATVSAAAAPPPPPSPPPAPSRLRRVLRGLSHRLPPHMREPMVRAFWLQVDCLRTLRQAARVEGQSWRALKPLLSRPAKLPSLPPAPPLPPPPQPSPLRPADGESRFIAEVRPGDLLLALGSPWWHPELTDLVGKARSEYGMRFGMLVYDLIPLLHSEWCDRGVASHFREWFCNILPRADLVMAISQATARDVETYAARHALPLPGAVLPIPIGTGFTPPPRGGTAEPPVSPDLPAPGSYALFVSTIEARKNHLLLLRVWQRLLAEMPEGSVPKLVFAGKVGWMVADLMAQLANTSWLDGHVVLIESPSDADLAALYRGCLFTLFPSFFEGWGLPVTESLAFGKPCITADNSSLPEAGSGLTRMFDADNLHDATRVIRETLQDRPGLAAWEAKVRREFRPTPWSETARAILAACDTRPVPPGTPAPGQ